MKKLIEMMLLMSIRNLYEYDLDLLSNKVSERCVCSRLAFYLEKQIRKCCLFNNYYVDVEYDRMWDGQPKHIGLYSKKHICDLLIHSRGKRNPDNLLALELKIHNNYSKVNDDKRRLRDLVQHRDERNNDTVCETLYGVFLRLKCEMFVYQIFDIDINNGTPSKPQRVLISEFLRGE